MDSLRIGDAERESAVQLLGEQYALGRFARSDRAAPDAGGGRSRWHRCSSC